MFNSKMLNKRYAIIVCTLVVISAIVFASVSMATSSLVDSIVNSKFTITSLESLDENSIMATVHVETTANVKIKKLTLQAYSEKGFIGMVHGKNILIRDGSEFNLTMQIENIENLKPIIHDIISQGRSSVTCKNIVAESTFLFTTVKASIGEKKFIIHLPVAEAFSLSIEEMKLSGYLEALSSVTISNNLGLTLSLDKVKAIVQYQGSKIAYIDETLHVTVEGYHTAKTTVHIHLLEEASSLVRDLVTYGKATITLSSISAVIEVFNCMFNVTLPSMDVLVMYSTNFTIKSLYRIYMIETDLNSLTVKVKLKNPLEDGITVTSVNVSVHFAEHKLTELTAREPITVPAGEDATLALYSENVNFSKLIEFIVENLDYGCASFTITYSANFSVQMYGLKVNLEDHGSMEFTIDTGALRLGPIIDIYNVRKIAPTTLEFTLRIEVSLPLTVEGETEVQLREVSIKVYTLDGSATETITGQRINFQITEPFMLPLDGSPCNVTLKLIIPNQTLIELTRDISAIVTNLSNITINNVSFEVAMQFYEIPHATLKPTEFKMQVLTITYRITIEVSLSGYIVKREVRIESYLKFDVLLKQLRYYLVVYAALSNYEGWETIYNVTIKAETITIVHLSDLFFPITNPPTGEYLITNEKAWVKVGLGIIVIEPDL